MSHEQTTNWQAGLIYMLRGDAPKACDFCDQPFTRDRYPVPEEAGDWACSECVARWDLVEKEQ